MTEEPPAQNKNAASEPPAPEVLQPQSDEVSTGSSESAGPTAATTISKRRHIAYRPSHKATFIGVTVVVIVLVANAALLAFIMRDQAQADSEVDKNAVTLSPATLEKLGVSRNPVGSKGTELVVNPNSKFNGTVTVASDMSVSGQLKLNGRFAAPDAAFTKLQAGDTAVEKLNVNGDATISNLNLRRDMTVAGATRLQGPVTVSQLMTINNNLNVSGSLAVGGTLSVRNLQVSSLTSDTTLTIGGHIITRGAAPSLSAGSGAGSNGTVSISGSDTSGTVAVNVGTGGGNGVLASISFRNQFSNTPHVVITPVGRPADVYINRNAGGFSIVANGGLSSGGYAFDYIVMQ